MTRSDIKKKELDKTQKWKTLIFSEEHENSTINYELWQALYELIKIFKDIDTWSKN